MTEQEWLRCANPYSMLQFLQGEDAVTRLRRWRGDRVLQPVSLRKVVLFNSACGRRWWDRMREGTREYLIAQEQFADGQIDARSLRSSAESLAAALPAYAEARRYVEASEYPHQRGDYQGYSAPDWRILFRPNDILISAAVEMAKQVSLLCDIVGNPFRPVTIDASWLTSTVVSFATAIYDERAFDRLPILADALEDAGCDDADLLNHCRQPGEHVRGCWAVDLVLGKS
jgi:hypothetical protein